MRRSPGAVMLDPSVLQGLSPDEAQTAAWLASDDMGQSHLLDGWEAVLGADATRGMALASADTRVAGREAWSTGIEFPAGGRGSLLCTQRWVDVAVEGAPAAWRLAQHRTIPYAEDTDAAACLRCDRRGCCALQRTGPRGPAGMPGDGRA